MKVVDFEIEEIDEADDMDKVLIDLFIKKTKDNEITGCPCYCIDYTSKYKLPQLSKQKSKKEMNHKVINESLKNCNVDVVHILSKLRKECIEKAKNICLFMFILDFDVSERVYMVKVGYIPANYSKYQILVKDLTTTPDYVNKETEQPVPLAVIENKPPEFEICSFALPSPVLLGTAELEPTIKICDAVKYLKSMFVILESTLEDPVLPCVDFFNGCSLAASQRTMAVNMLIIALSVTKNRDAVNKLSESFVFLIRDCEFHEAGFCAKKLIKDNPYYQPPRCMNADAVCSKVNEVIMRMYDNYSNDERRQDVPLAIRCLGYLFKND